MPDGGDVWVVGVGGRVVLLGQPELYLIDWGLTKNRFR